MLAEDLSVQLSYSGNGEVLVQVVEILSRCLVQIDRAFPQRDMVGGKFLNACFAVRSPPHSDAGLPC
jgi:hypothetical protein